MLQHEDLMEQYQLFKMKGSYCTRVHTHYLCASDSFLLHLYLVETQSQQGICV